MKKLYTLIAAVAVVLSANAQSKGGSSLTTTAHPSNASLKVVPFTNVNRAPGDSLMYMQLPTTQVNATDAPTFTIVTEDIDMLTTYNAGYAMDFGLYYSTDSSTTLGDPTQDNFYHTWEMPAPLGDDTAFFWSATSWFNPAGIADNWLEFGPLTIPAAGATLSWYDRTNRWRDGYEVLVTDVYSSPLSFADFTGSAIFTETDDAMPSATWDIDTTWEYQSVDIPASFNGMQVAIAFHHNANDMDVLRLDEIVLTEKAPASISEFVNGAKLLQNMPNPTSANTVITYELENSASVALNIFDVTGKLVSSQMLGKQNSGVHNYTLSTENLAAGMYQYSLSVDNASTASMKMVVIK